MRLKVPAATLAGSTSLLSSGRLAAVVDDHRLVADLPLRGCELATFPVESLLLENRDGNASDVEQRSNSKKQQRPQIVMTDKLQVLYCTIFATGVVSLLLFRPWNIFVLKFLDWHFKIFFLVSRHHNTRVDWTDGWPRAIGEPVS